MDSGCVKGGAPLPGWGGCGLSGGLATTGVSARLPPTPGADPVAWEPLPCRCGGPWVGFGLQPAARTGFPLPPVL